MYQKIISNFSFDLLISVRSSVNFTFSILKIDTENLAQNVISFKVTPLKTAKLKCKVWSKNVDVIFMDVTFCAYYTIRVETKTRQIAPISWAIDQDIHAFPTNSNTVRLLGQQQDKIQTRHQPSKTFRWQDSSDRSRADCHWWHSAIYQEFSFRSYKNLWLAFLDF